MAGEGPGRIRRWVDRDVLRGRSVEGIIASNTPENGGAGRSLDRHSLMLIGFAALIGAGIFRLTPISITTSGGLNTVVALAVAGVSFMATAMCYAEFASAVPVAGSAFTYVQAVIGFLPAWCIGCLLIIEYGVGAAAVTVNLALELLRLLPGLVSEPTGQPSKPMLLVVIVVAAVLSISLYYGKLGRRSAKFIVVVTCLKLLLIAIAVVGGAAFVVRSGYSPPDGPSRSVPLTWGSVVTAVSAVYFAYTGFDAVTTTADEATYPRRDLPRAMLYALAGTIIVYLVVAALSTVLLGNRTQPVLDSLAAIFTSRGLSFLAYCLTAGAIIGEATVVYVLMYGLSRILNAMCRELCRRARLDYRSSARPTGLAILFVFTSIVIRFLFPRIALPGLVNTATAVAFSFIVIGTLALRRSRPDLLRTYQVPLLPFTATVALVSNVIVLLNASRISWEGIAAVVVLGLIVSQIYSWLFAPPGKHATSPDKLTPNNLGQPST